MHSAAPTTPLLSIQHLDVHFRQSGTARFHAVKDVSFDIPPHSVVGLVGESGSGKSVCALSILGLLPADNTEIASHSRVIFAGTDLLREPAKLLRQRAGQQISMIFQDPMTSLNPVFRVGAQIEEVLRLHKPLSRQAAKQRAIALLDEVGIPDPEQRANSYPHELSGGQQQRVMIAIAIACEPKLLIADEPTTALDVTIQQQIIALLGKLRAKHGMSVLFISHDLELMRAIADHVVVMRQGEIQEQGLVHEVFSAPRAPYTKALLACRPQINSRPWTLPVVEDFLAGGAPPVCRQRPRGLTSDDKIILEARNLHVSFPVRSGWFRQRRQAALSNVSFKLAQGKTLGIVGESGSGKTTLGKAVLRLLRSQSGEVLYQGKNLLALSDQAFRPYKRDLQIVFQNPYASLNPRFTIGDILLEPMRLHRIHANDQDRQAASIDLLRQVGLSEDAFNKYPHEFSGGQRQRISIARCLSLRPKVLICDESVSALDVSVQAQVLNLLQSLQDTYQLSYLFISHDLSVVKYMSDEVLVMHQGEVVEMADADTLYRDPQHPYTQKLLAATGQ